MLASKYVDEMTPETASGITAAEDILRFMALGVNINVFYKHNRY